MPPIYGDLNKEMKALNIVNLLQGCDDLKRISIFTDRSLAHLAPTLIQSQSKGGVA